MSVCANRTDPPGVLAPCAGEGRRCVCGDQVAAELLLEQTVLGTQVGST